MTGIDRRGLFRALGLRVVAEVASPAATQIAGTVPRRTVPAPVRCLTFGELTEIATAEGLSMSTTQLEALARRSVRLTDADSRTAAWASVPPEVESSGRLGPGAVIALYVDRTAEALITTGLAGSGWLVVTLTGLDHETRVGRSTVLGVTVRFSDEQPAVEPLSQTLRLDAHVQLPRVWSEHVQALGLDAEEQDAYSRVRDRLAEAQGLHAEQAGGAGLPLNRLLGYPDDTSGTLPGECEQLAGPGRWTLLAQLSVGSTTRIFVWSAMDDPAQRVVALIR